jgi:O-acetyl-ADP-ribose deacetylase (regulator of RNase III)
VFSLPAMDPKLAVPGERVGVVNAANSKLAWGGGVCGAIQAEGDKTGAISAELGAWKSANGDLPVGGAMGTSGGSLGGVTSVVHAVGPNRHQGDDFAQLDACVKAIVQVAIAQNLTAIVMCNISSLIFGFEETATADRILTVLDDELATQHHSIKRVVFNNFPAAPPKLKKHAASSAPEKIDPDHGPPPAKKQAPDKPPEGGTDGDGDVVIHL